jgi:hypothetical protein
MMAGRSMNKLTTRILRNLRKVHSRINPATHRSLSQIIDPAPEVDFQGKQANDRIRELLGEGRPAMVSRMGGTEIPAVVTYLDMQDRSSFLKKSSEFIKGTRNAFWWTPKVKSDICNFSGFFPATEEMLTRYSQETLRDIKEIDLLGSWLLLERRLKEHFPPDMVRVPLQDLQPFRFENPWSEMLAGKKVLVIHPFEESVKTQYAKRKLLFKNPKVLPDFELKTLKSVQSLVGNRVDFSDWFAALNWMCEQTSKIDFDVAIVGAGAYGLPLAAHVKRMGRQAIHLGGVTQLLFGIRGKRWDDRPEFQSLYNEHWLRPQEHEKPANFRSLEAGAYW